MNETSGSIYLMFCSTSGKVYVGLTKDELEQVMAQPYEPASLLATAFGLSYSTIRRTRLRLVGRLLEGRKVKK